MARELVPCPSLAAWERHKAGKDGGCACPQECRAAYLAAHNAEGRQRRRRRRQAAEDTRERLRQAAAGVAVPKVLWLNTPEGQAAIEVARHG